MPVTRLVSVVLAAGLASGLAGANNGGTEGARSLKPPTEEPPSPADGPPAAVIQVALLLDTSNSMDGLIAQAKATLWAIVNEMGKARHDGAAPRLEVALYEYGNNDVPAEAGHVRRRAPFTTDLDGLSEALFALSTNGGSEHCGEAIERAVRELAWVEAPAVPGGPAGTLAEQAMGAVERGVEGAPAVVAGPVVKVLVIAGNEPFTQGSVAYQEAIAAARSLGVVVSAVHCGTRGEGIEGMWADAARLGGGLYGHIDADRSVAEPPTPYDESLSLLNAALNGTYLAYGASGREAAARQVSQDELNGGAGALYSRVAAKASAAYDNRWWDLVDAVKRGGVELSSIEADALPASLRELPIEAQREKIDALDAERARVSAEIRDVSARRAAFIAESAGKGGGGPTLTEALLASLRAQAAAQGLTFEE